MNELPDAIAKVRDAFEHELDAEVSVEQTAPARFRLDVFSPKFVGVAHLKRQDLLWAIVDRICTREESLLISVIIAFAPGEVTAFLEQF